jgi:hypothetical protein
MTVSTGINGALFFNGSRVGRCRRLDLNAEKEALRTTKQGDRDQTYRPGLRNTTATAELLYDPSDTVAVALLNHIWGDSTATVACTLQWNDNYQRSHACNVLVTRAGVSMAYGEAHVCDIVMQISGKPTGAF